MKTFFFFFFFFFFGGGGGVRSGGRGWGGHRVDVNKELKFLWKLNQSRTNGPINAHLTIAQV